MWQGDRLRMRVNGMGTPFVDIMDAGTVRHGHAPQATCDQLTGID